MAILNTAEPVVLGIETSCDETGIGIVKGRRLLANVISSSMQEHAKYGGVVPEIAARAHLESLEGTINQALAEAQITRADIDAVAVTAGPGLAGALMVGVAAAKALALALGVPLYGVNHLVGHVGAEWLASEQDLADPTVALLVSGGHTSLLLVRDIVSDVTLLGETIDDAAGEAFDKVARVLELPYPGGPHIDRVAADVARWVERERAAGRSISRADIAASFQEAVADVLVTKAVAACKEYGAKQLLLGGGVVANSCLRDRARAECTKNGVDLRVPPLSLCTDNGAMIAALGAQLIMAGRRSSQLDFSADSTLPVTEIMV